MELPPVVGNAPLGAPYHTYQTLMVRFIVYWRLKWSDWRRSPSFLSGFPAFSDFGGGSPRRHDDHGNQGR